MRFLRARVDGNQVQIVRELRALHFRVDIVSRLKKLYDIVVTGVHADGEVKTVRVEIKIDGGTLTVDELEYHRSEQYPETLIIAHSTDEVLKWFGR